MPQLINWDLLRQPYNWIIVGLMLATATMGLCLLFGGDEGEALSSLPLTTV